MHDPQFAARVPDHIRVRYQEIHKIHVENISLARRIGVRIALGSDAGTPGNHCGENMQELEVMVREAGFSELEAIQAATANAASLMNLGDQLGAIEEGKIADLLLVGDNPLDDVCAMRSVSFVMKEGAVAKDEREGKI